METRFSLNCRKQFVVHAINFVVVVSREPVASFVLQEHGLGTDVSLKHPDRHVSSFAAKLKFEDAIGGMIFIVLYLSWIAVASFFYVTNRWCSKPKQRPNIKIRLKHHKSDFKVFKKVKTTQIKI